MPDSRDRDGLSRCAKFGDCTYSRFGFIMQTDRQRRLNGMIAVWLTHATT